MTSKMSNKMSNKMSKCLVGSRVRYIGASSRILRCGDVGVVVNAQHKSRRTPLVKFDEKKVYIPRGVLELVSGEPLTDKHESKKSRRDKTRQRKIARRLEGNKQRWEDIIRGRETLKSNRIRRTHMRDTLRQEMKEEIYNTNYNKSEQKVGRQHQQIDTKITDLKDSIICTPDDPEERLLLIQRLNEEHRVLLHRNSVLKYMYANGHYTMKAHSPQSYRELCFCN